MLLGLAVRRTHKHWERSAVTVVENNLGDTERGMGWQRQLTQDQLCSN